MTKRARFFVLSFLLASIFLSNAYADWADKKNRIGIVYWHGDANERKITLTFDDGPNEPYTSQILDILKSHNVKATFFLIGRNVERYPQAVKREVTDGHAIGNHTYSHPDLALELKFQIENQIKKAEEAIFSAAGVRPHLFRPPYGLDNPWVFREAEKMGYVIIKWSVSGKTGSKDRIIKRVLSRVENGSIILLHDGDRLIRGANRSEIVKALPIIIESLQKEGYQFVTVPELLELENHLSSRAEEAKAGGGLAENVTYNEERIWYQDFFTKHLISAKPEGNNKVKFISDGFFGVRGSETSSLITIFSLGKGGVFYGTPDHHAYATFTVKEIKAGGVSIQYESIFDHRAFGKDLITKDKGTVEIKFKPK